MALGLLGKKVGMTRVFDAEAGTSIPVTVVDVSGNEFLQVKTTETDGYPAVQVGYDDQKEFRLNSAQAWPLQQIRHITQEARQGIPFRERRGSPEYRRGTPWCSSL